MLATQQQYSNILNPANPNEHYHVPKYQRAYSWGQINWEKLFDDISDNDPGHFIGSIICVRNDAHTQPGFDTIYELIDGQQRMTTLSLFLTAIYAKFGQWIELNRASLDEDELNEINAKKINLGRQIIRRIQSGSLANQPGCFKNAERHLLLRVQPSAQEGNLDDYKYIMNLAGLLTADKPSPSHFGNRRMAKAYYYFVNRLKDYGSQELERLCEKINQLMLVHIRVESNSDAFRLFETLNNRGVPLTAIDIIKNKMLAEMEHQKHADIDTSFDRWQTLIRRIDGNEDRFLRQYYNAFKHLPLVRVDRVTRATSSVLIKIYETLIGRDASAIFNDLLDKAAIYEKLIRPSDKNNLSRGFQELDYINAVSSYILLMYLMSLPKDSFENTQSLVGIVDFLQKYYVRRNITDTPSTRIIDQLQIDVIEHCEVELAAARKIDVATISTTLRAAREKPASLKDFADSLRDNLYYYNQWMARYILIKLDSLQHTREYCPDLWARNDKGDYVWTVEHIFPQGERIRQEWVDMMAGGDRDEANRIKDEHVHCLGNLTLSGYNSRLSNRPFADKQGHEEMTALGHSIQIGYNNNLALNNIKFPISRRKFTLATIEGWSEEAILSRNEVLVHQACDFYKFDDEQIDEIDVEDEPEEE